MDVGLVLEGVTLESYMNFNIQSGIEAAVEKALDVRLPLTVMSVSVVCEPAVLAIVARLDVSSPSLWMDTR